MVGIHIKLEGAVGLLSAELVRQKIGALACQTRIRTQAVADEARGLVGTVVLQYGVEIGDVLQERVRLAGAVRAAVSAPIGRNHVPGLAHLQRPAGDLDGFEPAGFHFGPTI